MNVIGAAAGANIVAPLVPGKIFISFHFLEKVVTGQAPHRSLSENS